MFDRKVTKKEAAQRVRETPPAVLDHVPLKPDHIEAALQIIRRNREAGRRVFIHCQLGLQRSALIAADWRVAARPRNDLDQAKSEFRKLETLTVFCSSQLAANLHMGESKIRFETDNPSHAEVSPSSDSRHP